MEDDVGAVLERTAEIRRGEGVVDDEGDARIMRDLGYGFDVGDEAAGVRDAFDEDGSGLGADGRLDAGRVGRVRPVVIPAELLEGVAELVDGAAI